MKKQINTLFKIFIRHPLEALVTVLAYLTFRCLPMSQASALGGWLVRKVGPFSSAQRTAEKNLKWVFPNKSTQEVKSIIEKVWDNFGRVMGEYPNLVPINVYEDSRFEIIGQEYIDQLRDDGMPGIIFAAHLASWEVAIMAASQRGLKVTQLYRATNNPYVDKIVRMVQRQIGQEVLTKGPGDARKVLASLRRGDHLFILVDQKMNRGTSVPFFGRPAMTAPAAARMALRFQCPLVPARVERLGGVRFRITYYPPMHLPSSKDDPEAVYTLLCQMNEMLEGWIKERPDQWLWLHNRWPKD
ncbi:MAG: lauroyl acyltransferase [Pseudomonadota bacterium]